MNLSEIIEELDLKVYCGKNLLSAVVKGGYVSDLLSDVMGNAAEGDVWITLQSHMNVVAIASLKEIAAIILVNGIAPSSEVVKKAEEEQIVILGADTSTFNIAGRLYNMLH